MMEALKVFWKYSSSLLQNNIPIKVNWEQNFKGLRAYIGICSNSHLDKTLFNNESWIAKPFSNFCFNLQFGTFHQFRV